MESNIPPKTPDPLSWRPRQPSTAVFPLQFSIETLLLLTTLVAVCLGVTVAVPPLGLWLFAISGAALVRTLIVGKQHQAAAMPFPAAEKVSEFVISAGIMIVALVVWFLTLLAIGCTGGLAMAMLWDIAPPRSGQGILHYSLFWLAVIVIPLAAAGWFVWITRPR